MGLGFRYLVVSASSTYSKLSLLTLEGHHPSGVLASRDNMLLAQVYMRLNIRTAFKIEDSSVTWDCIPAPRKVVIRIHVLRASQRY